MPLLQGVISCPEDGIRDPGHNALFMIQPILAGFAQLIYQAMAELVYQMTLQLRIRAIGDIRHKNRDGGRKILPFRSTAHKGDPWGGPGFLSASGFSLPDDRNIPWIEAEKGDPFVKEYLKTHLLVFIFLVVDDQPPYVFFNSPDNSWDNINKRCNSSSSWIYG